jgi:hypothetical protein
MESTKATEHGQLQLDLRKVVRRNRSKTRSARARARRESQSRMNVREPVQRPPDREKRPPSSTARVPGDRIRSPENEAPTESNRRRSRRSKMWSPRDRAGIVAGARAEGRSRERGWLNYSHVWRHSEMVVASRSRRRQSGHVMQRTSSSRFTITITAAALPRRPPASPSSPSSSLSTFSFTCSSPASAAPFPLASASSSTAGGISGDAVPVCMAWAPRSAATSACRRGAKRPPLSRRRRPDAWKWEERSNRSTEERRGEKS